MDGGISGGTAYETFTTPVENIQRVKHTKKTTTTPQPDVKSMTRWGFLGLHVKCQRPEGTKSDTAKTELIGSKTGVKRGSGKV